MGINCCFLFLSKNKDHVLYCLHNSYTRNLSHTNQGRRSGLPSKPKSLMYVNYSSNTHTPFPLRNSMATFVTLVGLVLGEHGSALLDKGILDMVEMKWGLVLPKWGIPKLNGVLLKIDISLWGHALECITVGQSQDQIRGHVEPLGLNESRQLMGDFIQMTWAQ
jgi:hypothetical protein